MLSDDVRAQGDVTSSKEMYERGRAHARRVQGLSAMLVKAQELLEFEKRRFSQYLPPEPLQRAERSGDREPAAGGYTKAPGCSQLCTTARCTRGRVDWVKSAQGAGFRPRISSLGLIYDQ